MRVRRLRLFLAGTCFSVLAQASPHTITFELAKPSKVSLNIYDPEGHVVREMLHAEPLAAGLRNVVWDGKDRLGTDVPAAGSCSWKILATPGLHASHVMNLGSSYPPGDGWRWQGPGCHHSPGAVAVDGSGVYVAAAVTENIETALLKLDAGGSKRLWSAPHPNPWDGGIAMAPAGGFLFMLGHNYFRDPRQGFPWAGQSVWKYVAGTGERAKGITSGNIEGGFDVRWDKQSTDAEGNALATDMDASDAAVVVAYLARNAIRWYDPATGALLDQAEVPSPAGVAAVGDGTVYVTSGNSILRLSRAAKTPAIVASGLTSPSVLDVDATDGTLLVWQGGISQQVKRVRISDGSAARSYGTAGGREAGLYSADRKKDFLNVRDLSSDGKGGFLVAERNVAPRRVAWFGRDGSLVREWYGGQKWAPWAMADPGDLSVVWMASNYNEAHVHDGTGSYTPFPAKEAQFMRLKVDYDHKTWQVHSTYRYAGLAGPDGAVAGADNQPGDAYEILKRGGRTYLAGCGPATVLEVDTAAWNLVPVVQSALGGAIPHVDARGDYWSLETGSATVPGRMRFRRAAWEPAGPRYGPVEEAFTLSSRSQGRFDPRWSAVYHHDVPTGNVYVGMNAGITGWCANTDSYFAKYNPDRRLVWEVGAKGARPGMTDHFRRIAGMVHGCPVLLNVADENESGRGRSYVWDADGLWVGGLMDSLDLEGISRDAYGGGGEWLQGQILSDPRTGVVYLFACWTNETRVYRIGGWDGWLRMRARVDNALGDVAALKSDPSAGRTRVAAGTGPGFDAQGRRAGPRAWERRVPPSPRFRSVPLPGAP